MAGGGGGWRAGSTGCYLLRPILAHVMHSLGTAVVRAVRQALTSLTLPPSTPRPPPIPTTTPTHANRMTLLSILYQFFLKPISFLNSIYFLPSLFLSIFLLISRLPFFPFIFINLCFLNVFQVAWYLRCFVFVPISSSFSSLFPSFLYLSLTHS